MDELEAVLETGGAAAVEIAATALAERGAAPMYCANCKRPLIGPYCALCGQPHNTHRRSLGKLIHELVRDIVSFDSRILRTAKALTVKPGELPLAFREGRTQRYVPAVRLYLFVSLLFFLFLSATGIAFIQLGLQVHSTVLTHDKAGRVIEMRNGQPVVLEGLKSDAQGNVSLANPRVSDIKIPEMKADGHTINNTITTKVVFFQRPGSVHFDVSPEIKNALAELRKQVDAEKEGAGWAARGVYTTLTKLETDPTALNAPLTTWIPRILFVLLPLFAVLLAVFYWGRRKEFLFVDHLVFSLTMHTFAFVVLIGAAVAAQFMSGGWVAGLTVLVLTVYAYLSFKHFYGQGWVRTGLKFASIAIIYALFFLAPAVGFAIVASVFEG